MTEVLTPAATRVLDAASELFYRDGIHAVGVDGIAAAAGVTKKTIYDRFGSKDALVVAYLRRRDELWRALLEDALSGIPDPSPERVLTLFGAASDWHGRHGGRGCSAINARAEFPDPDHPVAREITRQKTWVLRWLVEECTAAGADDPARLATGVHLLYEGALSASGIGVVERPFAAARTTAAALCAGGGCEARTP